VDFTLLSSGDCLPAPAERASIVLERYRKYLEVLGELQLDRQLRSKIDLSGVVQQTLLEAHQALSQLKEKQCDIAVWLRRILANNLADEIRKASAGKRDLGRQRSLEQALEASSCKLGIWLASGEPSPSAVAHEHERAVRVAEALASLPEAQREALELQHWQSCSLAEISERMGRSRTAVAGLIKRGLAQLRRTMKDEQ
jgi:RNA polymerase sigma-70 factor (ECF subfamily)